MTTAATATKFLRHSSRDTAGNRAVLSSPLRWWLPIVLILIFFASRVPFLTELPLHNDEGLAFSDAETAAPGIETITRSLETRSVVYVLADNAPLIGADVSALASELGVTADQLGLYPRPGETLENASVVLWNLSR